ncbi:MAG: putative polysaccharide biosynthesis protein [Halanaerobiaceae bacterium]
MENKNRSFIKGAITLGTAGIIAKIMGFSYRIILPRMIGAEGVGLYQLAYPVYTSLLVISTTGVPISLAKLISGKIAKDKYKQAYKIFRVCLGLSMVIGLFLTLIMALLSRPIINLFSWDPRSIYSVLALAPAIFIVSIMSSYRGFFQGLQNMVPTAYSQVIEQFIRIVTMIILVYILLPYGIEFAAAGATFGAVVGAVIGLILLIYIYIKKRKSIWENIDIGSINNYNIYNNIRQIVVLAVPVTFGAMIQPLMSFIDAAIVPARLQIAGFTNSLELYGQLSGMAMVLVHFPTVITLALSTSLVPAISEAYAQRDYRLIRRRTQSSLRLTILISLPAATGLFILAKPLTTVLFDTPEAATTLRLVALGVLFIALKQITSAILQGMGQAVIPARNLLIGAVFNAIINYILTASPDFGIRGAALGTVTGFAIAAFLNIYSTRKRTKFRLKVKQLLFKPLISVLVMSVVVHRGFIIIQDIFSHLVSYSYSLTTFSMVVLGILIYFLTLLLFNEIKYYDLILIPKIGKKLADFLLDLGLVKK